MYIKLIGDSGCYVLAKIYCNRWVVLSEYWGDGIIDHIYLPESKTKIQFTGNGVRFFYSDLNTYLKECTLDKIPSWVTYIQMI